MPLPKSYGIAKGWPMAAGQVAAMAGPPASITAPAITGTATEGQVLTASTGLWSNSPTEYTYQWKRAGVDIAGSVNNVRTLTAADVGSAMTVSVTATNAEGFASVTSAATSAVAAASPDVPGNTVAPVISGTQSLGETLTTTNGTWTHSPTSYTYQWRRDGVNIGGATASTYVLTASDASTSITCQVTAVNDGGGGVATSNALVIGDRVFEGLYTIKSGAITGSLTDFPCILPLTLLVDQSGFWSKITNQGGNLRAYEGATRIPLDVIAVDKNGQTGYVAVKPVAATVGTQITITCENNAVQPAFDASYGRYAVWPAYHAVLHLGATNLNRCSNVGHCNHFGNDNGPRFDVANQSGLLTGYQGIMRNDNDGTYIVTGTNSTYRYGATAEGYPDSTNVLASNTDPITAAGLAATTVNHQGDGCFINGTNVYVAPFEYYGADPAVIADQHIVAFDGTTLGYLAKVNMSAAMPTLELSGLWYCPLDGLYYGTNYRDGGYLYRFEISYSAGVLTVNRLSDFAVTYIYPSATTPTNRRYQGGTWYNGQHLVTDNSNFHLQPINADGNSYSSGLIEVGGYEIEGLTVNPTRNTVVIMSRLGSGSTCPAFTITPKAISKGGGGGVYVFTELTDTQRLETMGLTIGSGSFTFGTSYLPDLVTSANRAIVGVGKVGSDNPNYRMTLAQHAAVWGIWDSTTASWLDSGVAPVAATAVRIVGRYDRTAVQRSIAVNGTVAATAAASAQPIDFNRIMEGVADLDPVGGESSPGSRSFTFVAKTALSNAWIAADNLMLTTPASFYDNT